MGLESATYISGLVATNPINATDVVGQGDDHLRLIKSTLLNTLPGLTGAMTMTHTQLNNAAIKNEANVFTNGEQRIQSIQPTLWFDETDASANAGVWRLIAAADTFYLQASDDAETSFWNPLSVVRSGLTVTNIQMRANEMGLVLGTNFAVYDSDNDSYLVADHDGTDFNYLYANTTAINYGGLAHCFSPVATHGVNQRLLTVYDSAAAGVVASFESASAAYTLVDLDNTNASPTNGAQIRFNLAGVTKSVIGFSPNTSSAAHVHMANGHTASPHHTFYVEGSGYYNLQGGGIRIYDSLNTSALEMKHASAAVVNFTGIGSTNQISTNCSLKLTTGAIGYAYDATNADYIQFSHNGTEGFIGTNSGALYISPESGIAYFYKGGAQAKARVYNSAGTAYADIYHNGSNTIIEGNTGKILLYENETSNEDVIQTQGRTGDNSSGAALRHRNGSFYDAGFNVLPYNNTLDSGALELGPENTGNLIYYNTATARTLTAPASYDGPDYSAWTVHVGPSAGTLTLQGGTGVFIRYWNGSGWTQTAGAGSVTLGEGQHAIMHIDDTLFIVNGPNIS